MLSLRFLKNGPTSKALQSTNKSRCWVLSILWANETKYSSHKYHGYSNSFEILAWFWNARIHRAFFLRLIILWGEKLLAANNQIFSIGKNYALHKNKRIRGLCSSWKPPRHPLSFFEKTYTIHILKAFRMCSHTIDPQLVKMSLGVSRKLYRFLKWSK